MRSKVTLVLLFLNVALFFFIFYFERDWRIEHASQEARHRVLGDEASAIRRLEVTSTAPGASFTLELRGDTWFLTSPVEWPANPAAVSHILNELQGLENVTSFPTRELEKNGQKLADYGLDQPKLTLSFTSGDDPSSAKESVLRIGDTTKVGDRLYLLSSDGQKIHVVGRSLADSLSIPFEELRSDVVFSIPTFEARSLNLQTASPSSVRVRIDREGGGWTFRTPVSARAAKNATDLAINDLDALRVKSFVLQNPPAALPSASPSLRVTLEGNNRNETLFVGAAAAGGGGDYVAQLEGRSAVFVVTIPKDLMEMLRDAADVLRDRHILFFDPSTVTSISLSALNQPEITLQRLEAPAGGHPAAWQITQRSGAAPTQPMPADPDAVKGLLDRLETLSAVRFQSDAPTNADIEEWGFNRPEREVTLTFGGTSATQTLQIGLPTQRQSVAYARIAGLPSVYAVEPDILGEASASPLAWRERLLSTLPESARITSLALTGAADGAVIFSKKLADGEDWDHALAGETPARREAAETILSQLRSLRAAGFAEEGFPDKVLAAGEMRPWKYRLDAVVSLPGGAGQVNTMTLFLAERTGSTEQLAGSKEIGAVFRVEQPLLDAVFTLTQP
ncbi:MAG TPA: DUF4340 domain-containing protein [Opitutaceae bacterium]|jgi:hypothetical protein